MDVKDLIDVRCGFGRLHMIRWQDKKLDGIVEVDGC